MAKKPRILTGYWIPSSTKPRGIRLDCKSDLVVYSHLNVSNLTKTLIEEIEGAPEPVQREVLDFIIFLKAQQTAKREGAENLLPLAHSAWAADWSTPEEDEAWRDL